MTAHYFRFSRDFDGNGRRKCAECRLQYDDGEHIEVTVLEPYTSYVCPSGGGLGHKSVYTGAYRPEHRSPSDAFCCCGAELVEEDRERWRVAFETQTPLEPEWHPVEVVRSKHAAHQQHAGLLLLVTQGEPIRNVVLERVG